MPAAPKAPRRESLKDGRWAEVPRHVNPNPNTEASFAETIVDLLRQRSAYRPHDRAFTFLVDGEQEELNITYAELDRKARTLGAWLQASGMTGKRVLLLFPSATRPPSCLDDPVTRLAPHPTRALLFLSSFFPVCTTLGHLKMHRVPAPASVDAAA